MLSSCSKLFHIDLYLILLSLTNHMLFHYQTKSYQGDKLKLLSSWAFEWLRALLLALSIHIRMPTPMV